MNGPLPAELKFMEDSVFYLLFCKEMLFFIFLILIILLKGLKKIRFSSNELAFFSMTHFQWILRSQRT